MRGLETRLINIAGVAASLFSWAPSRQSAFTGHCTHDTRITNHISFSLFSISLFLETHSRRPDVRCGCDLNVNTKIRDRWPVEKYDTNVSCTVVKGTQEHDE